MIKLDKEDEIQKIFIELLENGEVKNMIKNFIEISNFDRFYKISNILQLEKMIKRKYDEKDATLSVYYSKMKGNPKKTFDDNEICIFIKNFFNELVNLFIVKYHLYSKEIADYVVLKLLYTTFQEKSSEYIEDCFKNINLDTLTLDECILEYIDKLMVSGEDDNLKGCFVFYLIHKSKFNEIGIEFDSNNYIECRRYFDDLLKTKMNETKEKNFETMLLLKPDIIVSQISIENIDLMNGIEFEVFVCSLFNKMGYFAKVTKGSGDQGVDIIAQKNGINIGIQTKNYTGKVSNTAVQEIVAGIKFYGLNRAMVITNSYFSDSAIALANSNGVILWDRDLLKIKIKEYYQLS